MTFTEMHFSCQITLENLLNDFFAILLFQATNNCCELYILTSIWVLGTQKCGLKSSFSAFSALKSWKKQKRNKFCAKFSKKMDQRFYTHKRSFFLDFIKRQVYNLFQDLWNRLIILRGGEWVQSQLCAKS